MRPKLVPPPGYQALALRSLTLPPSSFTNCFIIGHQNALIVDPGSPFRGENDLLSDHLYRQLGSAGSLNGIVLTHHHPDHISGACDLIRRFDLPIFAHPLTIKRAAKKIINGTFVAIDSGSIFEVDQTRELIALHTPGHAEGHLCLYEETPMRRILVGGDMVLGNTSTLIDPFAGGDMHNYLSSLNYLAQLNVDCILPAHGAVFWNARQTRPIEKLINRRQKRHKQIESLLGEVEIDEYRLARQAYWDLPLRFFSFAWRSTCAHLELLRREGKTVSGSEGWRLPSEKSHRVLVARNYD